MNTEDRIEQEYKGKGRILTIDEFYKRKLSFKEFYEQTRNEIEYNKSTNNHSNMNKLNEIGMHIHRIQKHESTMLDLMTDPDLYIKDLCYLQGVLSSMNSINSNH